MTAVSANNSQLWWLLQTHPTSTPARLPLSLPNLDFMAPVIEYALKPHLAESLGLLSLFFFVVTPTWPIVYTGYSPRARGLRGSRSCCQQKTELVVNCIFMIPT